MGVIVFLVQDLFENIISVIIDIIDTSKPIKDIKKLPTTIETILYWTL